MVGFRDRRSRMQQKLLYLIYLFNDVHPESSSHWESLIDALVYLNFTMFYIALSSYKVCTPGYTWLYVPRVNEFVDVRTSFTSCGFASTALRKPSSMRPDVAGDSGDDPLRKICRSAEIQRKSNVKGCEGFTQFTLVYGMNCSSKAFFFWPIQVILKRHPQKWFKSLTHLRAENQTWSGWHSLTYGFVRGGASFGRPWLHWKFHKAFFQLLGAHYHFLTLHEWYTDDVPPKRPLNGRSFQEYQALESLNFVPEEVTEFKSQPQRRLTLSDFASLHIVLNNLYNL